MMSSKKQREKEAWLVRVKDSENAWKAYDNTVKEAKLTLDTALRESIAKYELAIRKKYK